MLDILRDLVWHFATEQPQALKALSIFLHQLITLFDAQWYSFAGAVINDIFTNQSCTSCIHSLLQASMHTLQWSTYRKRFYFLDELTNTIRDALVGVNGRLARGPFQEFWAILQNTLQFEGNCDCFCDSINTLFRHLHNDVSSSLSCREMDHGNDSWGNRNDSRGNRNDSRGNRNDNSFDIFANSSYNQLVTLVLEKSYKFTHQPKTILTPLLTFYKGRCDLKFILVVNHLAGADNQELNCNAYFLEMLGRLPGEEKNVFVSEFLNWFTERYA